MTTDRWLALTKITKETGDRLADQRGWESFDAMVEDLGLEEGEILGNYLEELDCIDADGIAVTGELGSVKAVNWFYDGTVGGYRVFSAFVAAITVPKETVNERAYVPYDVFEKALL